MPQGTKISFVTWPDGRVDEASLTLFGERFAREAFLADQMKHLIDAKTVGGYLADEFWRPCRLRGFKVHTIEIGEDGKPVLVER